jgi:hypothetical protein
MHLFFACFMDGCLVDGFEGKSDVVIVYFGNVGDTGTSTFYRSK